jgi:hypothetical protein
MAEPTESTPAPAARTDRSPWNWLLVIPIVLPVLTPIYNFDSPRLWGFPAFYWLQFAFILVGVATTSVVYQMTRRPSRASSAPVSPTPAPSVAPPPAASPPAASPPGSSPPGSSPPASSTPDSPGPDSSASGSSSSGEASNE